MPPLIYPPFNTSPHEGDWVAALAKRAVSLYPTQSKIAKVQLPPDVVRASSPAAKQKRTRSVPPLIYPPFNTSPHEGDWVAALEKRAASLFPPIP